MGNDITAVAFSERGEEPTAFERALLEGIDTPATRWMLIAKLLRDRLGTAASAAFLATTFDELGGEIVYVPSRTRFFARLWRAHRNEQILAYAAAGHPLRAIAEAFGMDESSISRIITSAGRVTCALHAVERERS